MGGASAREGGFGSSSTSFTPVEEQFTIALLNHRDWRPILGHPKSLQQLLRRRRVQLQLSPLRHHVFDFIECAE